MMAHKRLIFMFLGMAILMVTQVWVEAQAQLMLSPTANPPDPTASQAATTIPAIETSMTIGDTLEFAFAANDIRPLVYRFTGTANQAINVDLTILESPQNTFPCTMNLIQPNGRRLSGAEKIESDSGQVTAIHYALLPIDGAYTIEMWGCGVEGRCGLALSEANVTPVAYETIVEGIISPTHPSDAYRFKGQRGEKILIREESLDWSPEITISCLKGCNEPASINTDNHQAPLYEVKDDGDYIVIVRSNVNFKDPYLTYLNYPYKLMINRLEFASIDYGMIVKGTLTTTKGVLAYQFSGELGDTVRIHTNSNEQVDTRLYLLENMHTLIMDDDGGKDFDPEIFQVTLDEPSYQPNLILLVPVQMGHTGSVELSLGHIPIPSLYEGKQTLQISSKLQTQALRFSGIAKQKIRVTIHRIDGAMFGLTFEIWQHETQLSKAGVDANTDTAVVEFTVPEDGDVRILVNGPPSKADLTLERLD